MEILEKAKVHFQSNLPFVLFAEPNETDLKAYFQNDDELHQFENQSGFVFVSFDGNNKVVLPKQNSEYYEEKIGFNIDFKSESIQIPTSHEDKIHFKNLVDNSVEAIKSGNFEKLVVSRKIEFSDEIDIFETYQNLLKTYSSALKSLLLIY